MFLNEEKHALHAALGKQQGRGAIPTTHTDQGADNCTDRGRGASAEHLVQQRIPGKVHTGGRHGIQGVYRGRQGELEGRKEEGRKVDVYEAAME